MARRTRHNSIQVYTEVEVDIDDVLEELTKDDLIEECKRRKIPLALEAEEPRELEDGLEDVLDMLRHDRTDEAILLLIA